MNERTLIAVEPERLERLERMMADVLARLPEQRAEWVSLREAARRYECSTDTIRRRIAKGELESRGTGKLKEVKI